MSTNFKTIILAAGLGKRMKTSIPKNVQKILGKSLIEYVTDAAISAGSNEIAVVVGAGADYVRETLKNYDDLKFYLQKEQLGTGHAVMSAIEFLPDYGNVVILQGDTPFTSPETIKDLVSFHEDENNGITCISIKLQNPTGYGRIVRDNSGAFSKIVEQKDATPQQTLINEINAGVYCVKCQSLKKSLKLLKNDNSQKEYYFTDLVEIIKNSGEKAGIHTSNDIDEFIGINTLSQLANAAAVMKLKINEYHMSNGVVITDPNNTYISPGVVIGHDTVIYPNTILEGKTEIGEGCIIGPNSIIRDSILRDSITALNSVITKSKIDSGTTIGPFAYIRPGSDIGKNVKIGDFVEVKNSVIGDKTKISHLTYVGDSDVGENVNFGCGTVTVNYDGKKKFRTTIKDNAFIGCNTNLIAPVTVHENAYTAAGSTITNDVPENSLSIAREKQKDIPGWVLKRK